MADWDERAEARKLKIKIEAIRDDLNKHHRNVNISRVTGSSVAIATGVPAVACAIAAPFTLGVTLIPAIVLGIIAAVGGGVSVGASVVEIFIKRHNVKEVQARWETFRQNFLSRNEEIAVALEDILQTLNAQTNGTSTILRADNPDVSTAVQGAGEVSRAAGGITSAVVRGVLRTTSTGIRVTAPLLSVASAIAIPLDIYDLVTSALRLHEGTPSTASESLTQIIEFLDSVADDSFADLFDNDLDIETALGLDSGNGNGNNLDGDRGQDNDNENNDETTPLTVVLGKYLVRSEDFNNDNEIDNESTSFIVDSDDSISYDATVSSLKSDFIQPSFNAKENEKLLKN